MSGLANEGMPFAFGINEFAMTPWRFEEDVEQYANLGIDARSLVRVQTGAIAPMPSSWLGSPLSDWRLVPCSHWWYARFSTARCSPSPLAWRLPCTAAVDHRANRTVRTWNDIRRQYRKQREAVLWTSALCLMTTEYLA